MRKAFAALAILLMLVVIAEFFFAASGPFSIASNEGAYRPHHALGYVIFLLPIVMAIVAALARMPGRLIGMTALVAGLTVVQVLIAVLARAFNDTGENTTTAGQLIFGLHALNGLIVLALAGTVVRRARALARSGVTVRPAGASNHAGMPGPAAGPAQPGS